MRNGNLPYGYCDRTGFRYDLDDLVEQYENGIPNGLLVGKDMLDIDHEQLRIGEIDANDPQTLDDPRPDQSIAESRALTSWNPVGAGGLEMLGSVGRVTVSTS